MIFCIDNDKSFQTNQCSQLICDTKINANASYDELKAGWYNWELFSTKEGVVIDVLPGTKCGSNAVR